MLAIDIDLHTAPIKSHSSSNTGTELNVVENSGENQTYTYAGAGKNMAEEASMKAPTESNYIEGYEMTKEVVPQESESSNYSVTGSDILASVFVLALLGVIFVGFKRRSF